MAHGYMRDFDEERGDERGRWREDDRERGWRGNEPDRSDRNVIEGNDIAGTTAEAVDIKEGTSDGVLRGNTFDGSAMDEADSWVDVKGNGWLIEGNTGTAAPEDGFQTHQILDGWGTGNVFRHNTAKMSGSGVGFDGSFAIGFGAASFGGGAGGAAFTAVGSPGIDGVFARPGGAPGIEGTTNFALPATSGRTSGTGWPFCSRTRRPRESRQAAGSRQFRIRDRLLR